MFQIEYTLIVTLNVCVCYDGFAANIRHKYTRTHIYMGTRTRARASTTTLATPIHRQRQQQQKHEKEEEEEENFVQRLLRCICVVFMTWSFKLCVIHIEAYSLLRFVWQVEFGVKSILSSFLLAAIFFLTQINFNVESIRHTHTNIQNKRAQPLYFDSTKSK